jgi:hypothetical protein
MQDIGVNVSYGNVTLDASWQGNAADAAFMYFADLSAKVSGQQIALNKLAEQYETAADPSFSANSDTSPARCPPGIIGSSG